MACSKGSAPLPSGVECSSPGGPLKADGTHACSGAAWKRGISFIILPLPLTYLFVVSGPSKMTVVAQRDAVSLKHVTCMT